MNTEQKIAQLEQTIKKASEEVQQLKELNKKTEITQRVKTFKDAVNLLGTQAVDKIIVKHLGDKAKKIYGRDYASLPVFVRLCIITAALNQGWASDWSNSNEYKYFPWFIWSGCGFSFADVCTQYTNSNAASSLYFSSRELAEYCGKQFIKEYNEYLSK